MSEKEALLVCTRCGGKLKSKNARWFKGRPFGSICFLLIKKMEGEKSVLLKKL